MVSENKSDAESNDKEVISSIESNSYDNALGFLKQHKEVGTIDHGKLVRKLD